MRTKFASSNLICKSEDIFFVLYLFYFVVFLFYNKKKGIINSHNKFYKPERQPNINIEG